MNEETHQPSLQIPPTPPTADQPRKTRPKPAVVIGIFFLCLTVFKLNSAGGAAMIFFKGYASEYHLFLMLVSLVTAVALLVCGIGLIRMLRWARQAAVITLLCIIGLKIYICFTTREFTLAPPEQAAHELVSSIFVFALLGFLINRLNLKMMKEAFELGDSE